MAARNRPGPSRPPPYWPRPCKYMPLLADISQLTFPASRRQLAPLEETGYDRAGGIKEEWAAFPFSSLTNSDAQPISSQAAGILSCILFSFSSSKVCYSFNHGNLEVGAIRALRIPWAPCAARVPGEPAHALPGLGERGITEAVLPNTGK